MSETNYDDGILDYIKNKDGSKTYDRTTDSLEVLGELLEILEDHMHKPSQVRPMMKAPITVTGHATAWTLGAAATIIGVVQNLDNAAAVDAGGGIVTIPLTGHGYVVGEYVTISGSVNYNTTYEVVAVPGANTFNITATYQAETFAGTEECVDVIPDEFDIHFINFEAVSAADTYELVLYRDDASVAANEIGRVRTVKAVGVSAVISTPIQGPRLPAGTKIFAKLASAGGGSDTANISVALHEY